MKKICKKMGLRIYIIHELLVLIKGNIFGILFLKSTKNFFLKK